MELTNEQNKQFLHLSCRLSPENLACDGECSKAEVRRRYKAIMTEWAALEKIVGRKVSEDEVRWS